MRMISVTIPEELDRAAAEEAKRRGISKSELIRMGLLALLPELGDQTDQNPWVRLAGFGPDEVTAGPDEIDTVVYE